MALGTITINQDTPNSGAGTPGTVIAGTLKAVNVDVVMDSSYPTGGSSLTAAQLGLGQVIFAQTNVKVVGANGPVVAYYDIPNSKIKAFSATGEVANTTNLSTATVQITAYGI